MNENTKIGVYYIATGDYKILFPEFLKSVKNLFPRCKKAVKLISDGLEEYKDYEEDNVKVELCPRINNYPWPVVALYKMWHILENYDSTCDYMCYFNANSVINAHSENIFDFNKISISYHSFNGKNNPYYEWKYINIDPYSRAYLENETYEYVQSGFFFGNKILIKKMCEDVVAMIRYDTARHMFAQWHDESYLNKWCVENPELVYRQYYLTIYPNDVDETRFIFLRRKNDYFDLKK